MRRVLVDLVGSPASRSALDVMTAGVTIGIVTNNKDTEQKYGHVKVKLPYLGGRLRSESRPGRGWSRSAPATTAA